MAALLTSAQCIGVQNLASSSSIFSLSHTSNPSRIYDNLETRETMTLSMTDHTGHQLLNSTHQQATQEAATSPTNSTVIAPVNLAMHPRELQEAISGPSDAMNMAPFNLDTHPQDPPKAMTSSNDTPTSTGTLTIGNVSVDEPKFTLFSQLPIELRLNIWRSAFPLFPQIIQFRRRGHHVVKWNASTSTPSTLLHTSNESREAVLRFYENISNNGTEVGNESQRSDFRINLEVDTLLLDIHLFYFSIRKKGLYFYLQEALGVEYAKIVRLQSRLKNLAIDRRLATFLLLSPERITEPAFDQLDHMIVSFKHGGLNENRVVGFKERPRPYTEVENGMLEGWLHHAWRPKKVMICDPVCNDNDETASKVARN
ncbi:hypothetical protein BDZ45DRAFT_782842 [Acephala macrosclerotiorum]|nr:hypothetical protein BDZ45DRAFT_782842 [Acephala macrosclerotiorum]